MKPPRVLAGSPITAEKRYKRYCLDDYLSSLRTLSYPELEITLLLNGEGGDELIAQYPELNIKRTPTRPTALETVVEARNTMRGRVLQENFDYLLFLEQDIIPPNDLVERLMRHRKPVCSALYYNQRRAGEERHGVPEDIIDFPMAWKFDNGLLQQGLFREQIIEREALQKPLLKVDVCGLAVALIHRDVLEEVEFRFDLRQPLVFEEFHFGRDCWSKGIDIYLDCSFVCTHHCPRGI